MNDRLHLYLTTDPHQVLPSAKKNYPVYLMSPTDESSPNSDGMSISSAAGRIGKDWKKKVRFSKMMGRD
jgi:hypothetical protein